MNDAGRIGFLPRGDYDASTTYHFLDLVYYGNSTYVAKKVTVGNAPEDDNEYWHIFAMGARSAGPDVPGVVKADGTTTEVSVDGIISAIVLEKDGEITTSD